MPLDGVFYLWPHMLFAATNDMTVALRQFMGFHIGAGGLQTDVYHQGESWVQDSADVWHFILPNGEVHEWSGVAGGATGPLLTVLPRLAGEGSVQITNRMLERRPASTR